MVLTRAQNQPGPDGILGDDPATPPQRRERRRHPGRDQHGLALGRPEPDLHVASLPPGLPARVRPRRRQARRHRQAARRHRQRRDRHGDLGVREGAGGDEARPPPRQQGRARHPDARHRPVRQLHPRAGPWASAVRPQGRRRLRRGQHRRPGPGPGERPPLRHAVPDGHRAQRRSEPAGHGQQPGDAAGRPGRGPGRHDPDRLHQAGARHLRRRAAQHALRRR